MSVVCEIRPSHFDEGRQYKPVVHSMFISFGIVSTPKDITISLANHGGILPLPSANLEAFILQVCGHYHYGCIARLESSTWPRLNLNDLTASFIEVLPTSEIMFSASFGFLYSILL